MLIRKSITQLRRNLQKVTERLPLYHDDDLASTHSATSPSIGAKVDSTGAPIDMVGPQQNSVPVKPPPPTAPKPPPAEAPKPSPPEKPKPSPPETPKPPPPVAPMPPIVAPYPPLPPPPPLPPLPPPPQQQKPPQAGPEVVL